MTTIDKPNDGRTRPKMPISIQTFDFMNTGEWAYVDKTDLVYRLANDSRMNFLSRPRRFGKSLLISTLDAYFRGDKDLFKGLAMEKLETEWIEYPILRFDFANGVFDKDVSQIEVFLNEKLSKYEKLWGKDTSEIQFGARFTGLIERAKEKTGQNVVILIDEYDRALTQTLHNPKLNDEIKSVLKGFFGTLKQSDQDIRFSLLTGVTKFSKVSIFSDLNQLDDISLAEKYATICGITQVELEDNFEPEIQALALNNELSYSETLEKLKTEYNGYYFHPNGPSVYNPFSTVNVFSKNEFRNYWYGYGTPTLLAEEIKRNNVPIAKFTDPIEISSDEIDNFQAGNEDITPLLFQTGYLTIKEFNKFTSLYLLDFPNNEVKNGFYNGLLLYLNSVYKLPQMKNLDNAAFISDLYKGNAESFMTRLQAIYAELPYTEENKTEGFFHALFHLIFVLLGQMVRSEIHNSKGRTDSIVETPDFVYLFEFKLDGTGTPESAIKQIDDTGYADPYLADNRKIIKIGAVFDIANRENFSYKIQ
jgi:hypothetical protein